MKVIYLGEIKEIGIMKNEDGSYLISIGDNLNFDYIDGKFSQFKVSNKKAMEIIKEAKKMKEEGKTEQEANDWLAEQDKLNRKHEYYTLLTQEGNLTKLIDKLIEEGKPEYDGE